jgi:hypothetical protein
MKKYKLYREVQPVDLHIEELLRYIILPLIITSYVAYPVLYFYGVEAAIVFNFLIALTTVSSSGKISRLLTILNFKFQTTDLKSVVFRFNFFLLIVTTLIIADFGFYLLVVYQKENEFNIVQFYCWLLLLFGLPTVYYTIRWARYYFIKRQQDQDYTAMLLNVKYDMDNFISIENIQFVNSLNGKSSNITINNNVRVYSQKEFLTKKSKTRNHYVNNEGIREMVHIPSAANLLLLSWFSLTEEKSYNLEIPIPFEKFKKGQGKPTADNLKVVRGKELKILQLEIFKNGRIKLTSKNELLIECLNSNESESGENFKKIYFK